MNQTLLLARAAMGENKVSVDEAARFWAFLSWLTGKGWLR